MTSGLEVPFEHQVFADRHLTATSYSLLLIQLSALHWCLARFKGHECTTGYEIQPEFLRGAPLGRIATFMHPTNRDLVKPTRRSLVAYEIGNAVRSCPDNWYFWYQPPLSGTQHTHTHVSRPDAAQVHTE